MSEDKELDDAESEDEEEYPDDRNIGTRVGALLRNGLWWLGDRIHKNTLGFVYAFMRVLPVFGVKFWGKMAERVLYLYHKRVGGDAMGIEAVSKNHARLTPVKYRPPEACEIDEKPGWKAYGREKVWGESAMGGTTRLGKTPILALDNDSWRATSWKEARMVEAVDLGKTQDVYRIDDGATLKAEIDIDGPTGAGNGNGVGSAIADGGADVSNVEFEPKGSPIFEDVIVQIGGDDYDGRAVSFWKTKEMFLESTTSEEMENQETRGFLAGMSREDWKNWALKIMLIGAALAALGLVGPELISALLGSGSGGGGGGSVMPFSTAWWG